MAYKLIVLDVDGTLVDDSYELSPQTVRSIRMVQKKKNIHFTLATGRPPQGVVKLYQRLRLHIPIIAFNGALIKHPLEQKILFYKPIPVEIARKVVEIVEEIKADNSSFCLNLYDIDNWFVQEINEMVDEERNIIGFKPTIVEDFHTCLNTPFAKILVLGNTNQLLDLKRILEDSCGTEITVDISKPTYLEITSSSASKGNATQILVSHLGLSSEDVVAIGDSMNDLDMIKYAGLGVVVKNAPETLQKQADLVIPSNNDEGIVSFLEKLFFKDGDRQT